LEVCEDNLDFICFLFFVFLFRKLPNRARGPIIRHEKFNRQTIHGFKRGRIQGRVKLIINYLISSLVKFILNCPPSCAIISTIFFIYFHTQSIWKLWFQMVKLSILNKIGKNNVPLLGGGGSGENYQQNWE